MGTTFIPVVFFIIYFFIKAFDMKEYEKKDREKDWGLASIFFIFYWNLFLYSAKFWIVSSNSLITFSKYPKFLIFDL